MEFDSQAEEIDFADTASDIDTIHDIASRYRELKDAEESYDNLRKEAKKERESLAEVLYDKMIAEGLEKISIDIGSFKPDLKRECSIVKEFEDQAFGALEAHGLGASIKRQIHYQTLNKHYREGELVIGIEDKFFKTWTRKTIAMRRKNG